jgi:hypothetical protein
MEGVPDAVVSEAAELSAAVFSGGEEFFEEEYSGEVGNYILVTDLKGRIETALMDTSGEIPYLDELQGFTDFGYDAESAAEVFYSVEPGMSYSDLAGDSGLKEPEVKDLIQGFEDEGLVDNTDDGFFYGGKAFPYLMVLDEAEAVLEVYEEPEFQDEPEDDTIEREPFEEDFEEEAVLDTEADQEEEDEEDGKSLQSIMMDVAEDEDDLVSTEEQRDDGGIETRDHVDKESGDEGSNPGEDEYYEGW